MQTGLLTLNCGRFLNLERSSQKTLSVPRKRAPMGLILPSGLLASLLLEGGAQGAPVGSPQPGPWCG